MPEAKKPQPWDAVFSRIKAQYWPEHHHSRNPTAADLDAAEKALGFLFPLSYRAFVEEFGLGGTLGCSLPQVLHLFPPDGADPDQWWNSVVRATEFYRTYYGAEDSRYADADESARDFDRRVIVFAIDGGYHEWMFDPAEVTDGELREYAIYDADRSRQLTRIASSFPEWLTWISQHYIFESEEEAEEPAFPPVYKPDSADPAAMIYFRDSWSPKEIPTKPDVVSWLAFNNGAVRDLARSIRDGHTEAFPVLADALEEAGCANADLLDSCRTGDPDIDGVWVLRVLLGEG